MGSNRYLICALLALSTACTEQAAPPSDSDKQQSVKRTTDVSTQESSKIEVLDYENNVISLEKPAQRIIGLSPHTIENIFSAGAGDKTIGAVAYTDYPEAAKKIPIIGNFNSINIERIIELQPDLIIAWGSGNPRPQLEHLRRLGFKIYIDEPVILSDIARSIEDIGILAGTQNFASQTAGRLRKSLIKLEEQYAHRSPVKALYQIVHSPLQTINGKHIISDVMKLCGGKNIFANEVPIAPIVNIEAAIERNPQVIFSNGIKWQDSWQKYTQIDAVRFKHLFTINPDYLTRHTTRIINGIENVCQFIDSVRNQAELTD